MPKTKKSEAVLHDWVCELPFQMQALLLTAMRGPDENNKFNAAKAIIRYLRGAVIKPAGDWSGRNDNDFMWGEYNYLFNTHASEFWQDHDEYPHHFIMHLAHCSEVIGYKHPEKYMREYWLTFYFNAAAAFHMTPETEAELDKRLSDFGCGYHNWPHVKDDVLPVVENGMVIGHQTFEDGEITTSAFYDKPKTMEEYYKYKNDAMMLFKKLVE